MFLKLVKNGENTSRTRKDTLNIFQGMIILQNLLLHNIQENVIYKKWVNEEMCAKHGLNPYTPNPPPPHKDIPKSSTSPPLLMLHHHLYQSDMFPYHSHSFLYDKGIMN